MMDEEKGQRENVNPAGSDQGLLSDTATPECSSQRGLSNNTEATTGENHTAAVTKKSTSVESGSNLNAESEEGIGGKVDGQKESMICSLVGKETEETSGMSGGGGCDEKKKTPLGMKQKELELEDYESNDGKGSVQRKKLEDSVVLSMKPLDRQYAKSKKYQGALVNYMCDVCNEVNLGTVGPNKFDGESGVYFFWKDGPSPPSHGAVCVGCYKDCRLRNAGTRQAKRKRVIRKK